MGRFGATVHIRNEIGRTEFVEKFCDVMKKQGFISCEQDEAAKTYLLAFGGDWAALVNEDYGSNPRQAYDDCKQIAKALKTSAFSVEVVDSDFAVLTLNDDDKVIVGDGSGYGIEEPERGSRKSWEPLLADGSTFEQFSEIVSRNEIFVEDTLCSAADILGVERELICADYDEIMEKSDDSNVAVLHLKKSAEKKITLNAAFKKVFGEALEPLGYKLIKSKYPYYVRVVNDEIIHIITLLNEPSYKRGMKCFKIFGGVATVYRDEIDLSKNPGDENINRMLSNDGMSRKVGIKYDYAYEGDIGEFLYKTGDEAEMLYELRRSLDITQKSNFTCHFKSS